VFEHITSRATSSTAFFYGQDRRNWSPTGLKRQKNDLRYEVDPKLKFYSCSAQANPLELVLAGPNPGPLNPGDCGSRLLAYTETAHGV